jgi:hypothetical protein
LGALRGQSTLQSRKPVYNMYLYQSMVQQRRMYAVLCLSVCCWFVLCLYARIIGEVGVLPVLSGRWRVYMCSVPCISCIVWTCVVLVHVERMLHTCNCHVGDMLVMECADRACLVLCTTHAAVSMVGGGPVADHAFSC